MRLQATVIRPDPDTIRFAGGAAAHPCRSATPATLIEGASTGGSGVLVLVRHAGDLVAGRYPLTALGDSTTVPGAHVAARYVKSDVVHGFALDSGSVDVERAGASAITVRLAGRGLEGVVRLALQAEFSGVPLEPDSAICGIQ